MLPCARLPAHSSEADSPVVDFHLVRREPSSAKGIVRVVGPKDLSAREGGGFRFWPANRVVTVACGKSRKQLVTGLQVPDAKEPGVLPDELRIKGGEVGGTDLRCCLSAAARR